MRGVDEAVRSSLALSSLSTQAERTGLFKCIACLLNPVFF
uniref:Uncharacterized protein n=1 Tax=Anguilla anguilla TaxID=7936 RepID=A0A0E9W8W4_ANGAN